MIVAVDPAEFNREQAKRFGATHTFADAADAKEALVDLTRGQLANSALVTVGVATGERVGEALSLVGKRGTVALTSLANVLDDQATVPMFELTAYQKRLVGCLFGNGNPRYDIPRLLDLYRRGELLLDELITRSYSLEQINEGYEDMRQHRNVRGVIRFD
jgi:S-(hydroxymethyl)glutathione dehydrogenase/alcohol dehydrogenase